MTRIAENRKAAFNYHFEERFEAGIVLEGWEVKSIRAGKAQLTDGYVITPSRAIEQLGSLSLSIEALERDEIEED